MERRQVSDKGLGFLTSALEALLQIVVFVSLTSALAALLYPNDGFLLYKCFLIVVPVVLGNMSRKYIHKFKLFVFVHILMIIAAVSVSSNDSELAVNVISVVVYVAYSIRLKNFAIQTQLSAASTTMLDSEVEKEAALRSLVEGEKVSLYCAVCMIIGYFAAYYKGNSVVMELEIALCIIFVVLQIIYGNVLSLYQVFRINKDKTNFPAIQMKKVTAFVTITVTAMILLGMMVFYNGEYGNIFTLVKNGLYSVAKFFVRLLLMFLGAFGKNAKETPVEETTKEAETEEPETTIFEDADGSDFMEALAEAFGLVLIIACIIGIIYVVREYIKNFNSAKKIGRDYIENVKPKEDSEVVEKPVIVNQRKETKSEKNVRKIYKRLVLKGNKGKAPDVSHTPDRLTTDNITDDKALADEITYIYEKARYSNENVSKSDIDKMKQL